jgi:hypothetical protein
VIVLGARVVGKHHVDTRCGRKGPSWATPDNWIAGVREGDPRPGMAIGHLVRRRALAVHRAARRVERGADIGAVDRTELPIEGGRRPLPV